MVVLWYVALLYCIAFYCIVATASNHSIVQYSTYGQASNPNALVPYFLASMLRNQPTTRNPIETNPPQQTTRHTHTHIITQHNTFLYCTYHKLISTAFFAVVDWLIHSFVYSFIHSSIHSWCQQAVPLLSQNMPIDPILPFQPRVSPQPNKQYSVLLLSFLVRRGSSFYTTTQHKCDVCTYYTCISSSLSIYYQHSIIL